jgi:hypothetical protein
MVVMNAPKLSLTKLLTNINPKEAMIVERMYDDYRSVMESIPGGANKHQAWEGGYISHIEEAMNVSILLYKSLSACRPLDFSLSDALFCVFLHDFDKIQRYSLRDGRLVITAAYDDSYVHKTAAILQDKYDYTLTDEQCNALKYAHGEGKDHNPTTRVMLPLATLVHCADVISARIWFDHGRTHDSWED